MQWGEELKRAVKGRRFLVLGVGNEMKADDGLGRHVIDNIGIENKIFCGEMPENFINRIKSAEPEVILIVDAVDFQGKPGEIVFAEAEKLEKASLSTHSLSFSVMSKMLPGIRIFLIGVQPESLEFGKPMSPTAKQGADEIAAALNALSH